MVGTADTRLRGWEVGKLNSISSPLLLYSPLLPRLSSLLLLSSTSSVLFLLHSETTHRKEHSEPSRCPTHPSPTMASSPTQTRPKPTIQTNTTAISVVRVVVVRIVREPSSVTRTGKAASSHRIVPLHNTHPPTDNNINNSTHPRMSCKRITDTLHTKALSRR